MSDTTITADRPEISSVPTTTTDAAGTKDAAREELRNRARAELQRRGVDVSKIGGAVQSAAGQMPAPPPSPYRPAALAQKAQEQAQRVARGMAGGDEGIDYANGVDFETQMQFTRMDNDEEKKKFLTSRYGKEKIFQDSLGNWVVMNDKGTPTSVTGGGIMRRFAASAVGNPLPLAGGIIGSATLGAISGGIGGAVGFGIGSAAGKAIDESLKNVEGFYSKTPKQEAQTLLTEGVEGAVGEGIGKMLRSAGRGAMAGYGPYNPPEIKAKTAEAMARGYIPSVSQAAPAAVIAPRIQMFAERIFGGNMHFGGMGSDRLRNNAAVTIREIGKKLKEAGVPDDQLDAEMERVLAKDVSTHGTGRTMQQVARDVVNDYTLKSVAARETAQKELGARLSKIDEVLPAAGPDLSANIRDSLLALRTDFSRQAGRIYGNVDALVGGAEIVPTTPLKETANSILEEMVKTRGKAAGFTREWQEGVRKGTGRWVVTPTPAQAGQPIFADASVVKTLNDIANLPAQVSFAKAQQIRSDLGKSALAKDLTPGVDKFQFRRLDRSADQMFAASNLPPEGLEAREALRAANDFYRDGIQKFKQTMIKRLVKEAGAGGVEPEKISQYILRDGQAEQAARIKAIVRPEQWAQIARQDFDSTIKESLDMMSEGKVSAITLSKRLDARGKTLDVIYGPKLAGDIRKYANELAALGGKVDAESLSPSTFKDTLRAAVDKQKALDSFMSENFLARLSMPVNQHGIAEDQVFDYILQPRAADRVKAARDFYMAKEGPSSPAWQEFRRKAMAKILSSAVKASDDPFANVFTGTGLYQTLSETYGREQLTELLGKETTNDLLQFAKDVQFVTQKGRGVGAGMIAIGSYMLHPLSHLGGLAELYVEGALLSTPGVVRWLSAGAKGETAAYYAIGELTQNVSRELALQARGKRGPGAGTE